MRPSNITEQLQRRPFKPFRIHLSDGSSYEVRHPEMALVTQATIAIAVDLANGDVPEDMVLCDPRHITKLVPVSRSKTKSPRSGKKKG